MEEAKKKYEVAGPDPDNMSIYNAIRRPPKTALKQITGGRLSGMTDINPQWRVEALTKTFGPCGIGWRYEITQMWMVDGGKISDTENEKSAFATVKLYIKHDGEWSAAIEGIGGSAYIANERRGVHTSDEAYKMAVTDALSVAMKALGVAADIYAGLWDGSKYKTPLGDETEIDAEHVKKIDYGIMPAGKNKGKAWEEFDDDTLRTVADSKHACITPKHKEAVEQVLADRAEQVAEAEAE